MLDVGKLSGPYIQLFFASRLHNNGHANLIATKLGTCHQPKILIGLVNFTHMHFRTHVNPESEGQSGRWQSEYHDVSGAIKYDVCFTCALTLAIKLVSI